MQKADVFVVGGARTPMTGYVGALKDFSAIELGAIASRGAFDRTGVKPEWVDHAVFGNVLQTSSDAIYGARHVALKSGVPIERPALTVNRLCGSGFEAIVQGAQYVELGEAQVADVAASFQATAVRMLVRRTVRAAQDLGIKRVVVTGGVAANGPLRAGLAAEAEEHGLTLHIPPPRLCTDNAAMIAWAGLERLKLGMVDDLDFKPRPRWPLDPAAPPAVGAGVKA